MERNPHSPIASPEVASALAKDPVCGMSVDPATAKHKAEHAGETVFFCSSRCREKFAAEPAKYLGKPAAVQAAAGPWHGEADGHSHRAQPQGQRPDPGAIYTCPMHPQIRQDHPGACPICGMALEPEVAGEATGPSAELIDMTRRFWIALALSVPVFVLEMGGHLAGRTLVLAGSGSPTGFSWRWRRRSRFGRDGRSSSAAGPRSRRAISTCSR